MTREEAIQILRTRIVPTKNWQEIHEAIDIAIEALSAEAVDVNEVTIHYKPYPSAEAEWIPVSEKLPNEDARYLAQMSYGIMQVLSWANNLEEVDDFDFYNEKHGGWYEFDSEWGYCERHDVLAWMPLPTPYKERNE